MYWYAFISFHLPVRNKTRKRRIYTRSKGSLCFAVKILVQVSAHILEVYIHEESYEKFKLVYLRTSSRVHLTAAAACSGGGTCLGV